MKKTNQETIRIGGRIPVDLHGRIYAYIEQTDIKVQRVLADALELYLKKNTAKN